MDPAMCYADFTRGAFSGTEKDQENGYFVLKGEKDV